MTPISFSRHIIAIPAAAAIGAGAYVLVVTVQMTALGQWRAGLALVPLLWFAAFVAALLQCAFWLTLAWPVVRRRGTLAGPLATIAGAAGAIASTGWLAAAAGQRTSAHNLVAFAGLGAVTGLAYWLIARGSRRQRVATPPETWEQKTNSEGRESMATTGRCHCGAISYSAEGPPEHHALCHCGDCRRWSGAPLAGWIAWPEEKVTVTGSPATYHSSKTGTRQFCGTCGTGLFYRNPEFLPGIIDIQSGTLDEPEAQPPGAQIMVKERLGWTPGMTTLPEFQTYPGMD